RRVCFEVRKRGESKSRFRFYSGRSRVSRSVSRYVVGRVVRVRVRSVSRYVVGRVVRVRFYYYVSRSRSVSRYVVGRVRRRRDVFYVSGDLGSSGRFYVSSRFVSRYVVGRVVSRR
ncbi:unnamed protein product, partial [Rotaria socialis]